MTAPADLYRRARERASVADQAGVTLYKSGNRWRGQCPVCKKGKGKKAGGPFSVDKVADVWICFAGGPTCEAGGDVIRLVQLMRHLESPRAAAEWLVGAEYRPSPKSVDVPPEPPRRVEGAKPSSLAARLWNEARSVTEGSPADAYLAARGIGPAVRDALRWGLRYHVAAFWGVWPEGRRVPPGGQTVRLRSGELGLLLPAMIAGVETERGRTGGVHVTYLAAHGAGKARVDPAKRMFGPQSFAGKPGGVRLTPLDGDWSGRPLINAEGIENAASAAEIHWRRTGVVPRMAAALSLNRLQGGWAEDGRGRFNVESPMADLTKPAFTWPDAGEVWTALDRDMSPIAVTVRGPGGRRVQRTLNADDRARVCGALAEQHWRAAGANPVRAIAPPAGLDFNDYLQEGAP